MTRKEAIAAGLKTYTGDPCRKCGCRKRYLCDYRCFDCKREYTRAKRNPCSHYRPRNPIPAVKPEPLIPTMGAAFPATLARLMAGR